MIHRNSLVVAATHDLELTTMVNDRFNNYHFQEDIKENDIEFDYILRKGAATSRNTCNARSRNIWKKWVAWRQSSACPCPCSEEAQR